MDASGTTMDTSLGSQVDLKKTIGALGGMSMVVGSIIGADGIGYYLTALIGTHVFF